MRFVIKDNIIDLNDKNTILSVEKILNESVIELSLLECESSSISKVMDNSCLKMTYKNLDTLMSKDNIKKITDSSEFKRAAMCNRFIINKKLNMSNDSSVDSNLIIDRFEKLKTPITLQGISKLMKISSMKIPTEFNDTKHKQHKSTDKHIIVRT